MNNTYDCESIKCSDCHTDYKQNVQTMIIKQSHDNSINIDNDDTILDLLKNLDITVDDMLYFFENLSLLSKEEKRTNDTNSSIVNNIMTYVDINTSDKMNHNKNKNKNKNK